jgi:ABC-type molybdate transport system substrate-binding protein
MQSLAPRLNEAAGCMVDHEVDLNPAIASRIEAGEPFDIGLTNPPHVARLAAAGRVDGDSARPFGSIPLAVCRKAGSGAAHLQRTDEIAALLSGATGIAYTGAGTSGQVFRDTMALMGLWAAIAPKSRAMPAGAPVASVVAQEIELAVVPLTTILSSSGVEVAAVFRDSPGTTIDLTVFLSPTAGASAAAVLDMLVGRQIDADLAAAGVTRPRSGWQGGSRPGDRPGSRGHRT